MTIARYIVLSSWIVFCLYWLVSARTVKRTKEKAGLDNITCAVIATAALLLLRVFGSPVSLSTRLIPDSKVLSIASSVLTLIGITIAIIARRRLGENWSSGVVLKEDHELMTTGLYRYVRHPIYSGVLLMGLGTAVVMGKVYAITVFVVVLVFIGFKVRREEKVLTKHFPNEYPGYKSRVKAIIPFVW